MLKLGSPQRKPGYAVIHPQGFSPGQSFIEGFAFLFLTVKKFKGGPGSAAGLLPSAPCGQQSPRGAQATEAPPASWSAGPSRWHPASRERIASPQGAPLGPRALLSSEVAFLERWHRLLTNGKLHSKTTLPTGTFLCAALISPSLPGTN